MKFDGDIAEHSEPIVVAQYHRIVDDKRDGEVFADKESGNGTLSNHKSNSNAGGLVDSPSSSGEEVFGGPAGGGSSGNQPNMRGLTGGMKEKKAKNAKKLAEILF
jgi:hypothetical protein